EAASWSCSRAIDPELSTTHRMSLWARVVWSKVSICWVSPVCWTSLVWLQPRARARSPSIAFGKRVTRPRMLSGKGLKSIEPRPNHDDSTAPYTPLMPWDIARLTIWRPSCHKPHRGKTAQADKFVNNLAPDHRARRIRLGYRLGVFCVALLILGGDAVSKYT